MLRRRVRTRREAVEGVQADGLRPGVVFVRVGHARSRGADGAPRRRTLRYADHPPATVPPVAVSAPPPAGGPPPLGQSAARLTPTGRSHARRRRHEAGRTEAGEAELDRRRGVRSVLPAVGEETGLGGRETRLPALPRRRQTPVRNGARQLRRDDAVDGDDHGLAAHPFRGVHLRQALAALQTPPAAARVEPEDRATAPWWTASSTSGAGRICSTVCPDAAASSSGRTWPNAPSRFVTSQTCVISNAIGIVARRHSPEARPGTTTSRPMHSSG